MFGEVRLFGLLFWKASETFSSAEENLGFITD